jgi:hypothetical protein
MGSNVRRLSLSRPVRDEIASRQPIATHIQSLLGLTIKPTFVPNNEFVPSDKIEIFNVFGNKMFSCSFPTQKYSIDVMKL